MDIPVWFTIIGLFLFVSYFSNTKEKQNESEEKKVDETSEDDFDDYEDGVDYV